MKLRLFALETLYNWDMKMSLADRFWSKVKKTPTCWLWTGGKTSAGYGLIWADGRCEYVHRIVWLLRTGRTVEPGLEIDHLCRVRHCVNPAHLEQVSHRVNVIRGEQVNCKLHRAGVCKRGHPATPENTKFRADGRVGECRVCKRERRRVQRAQRRLKQIDGVMQNEATGVRLSSEVTVIR